MAIPPKPGLRFDWRSAVKGGRVDDWLLFAVGAWIPVSTAAVNILAPFVVLLALRRLHEVGLRRVLGNPVVQASLALFAWMLVGAFYSPVGLHEALAAAGGYRKLFLVPFVATILVARPESGRWALAGFGAAMLATFLLSWPAWALGRSFHRLHDNAGTVFKYSITQNLLMSFAAWACWRWSANQRGGARVLGLVAALALAANVLFVVPARSGYVALAALALAWMLYRLRGWRLVGGLAAMILVVYALFAAGGIFAKRMEEGLADLAAYSAGKVEGRSWALRAEFYRNTLDIAAEHPVIGVGAGGFGAAYREKTKLTGARAATDPHSEYLLIAAQHGLIGIALGGWLAYALFTGLGALDGLGREVACGGLVVMASGSLVNSLLNASTEGHAFGLLAAFIAAAGIERHTQRA
jgi:O-antigen ligase